MGIFANLGITIIFSILILLVIVLASIYFSEKEPKGQAWWIISLILVISLGLGVFYSATHRVVPVNERWVIINTIKGQIDGDVRESGLIKRPFIGSKTLKFPGATERPFCITYVPALKEGYEITADVCGTYDAANLDWVKIYKSTNISSEEELLLYWANQSKEAVSEVFQNVDYGMLATERPEVSNRVRNNLQDWYDSFGVSVKSIKLTNWDFTSAEVKLQVDKASAASMQKTVESQLLEAAQISRERKLYEIETTNLVLQERGLGFEELIVSLGLEDDNAKAFISSQMAWLAYAENPPKDVQLVLSLGGGSLPLSIPIVKEEAPVITTTE